MLEGTIGLQANGIAIVAPDEHQPLIGTWHANATHIEILLEPEGRAFIDYTLAGHPQVLTLTFTNGSTQVFARLPVHKLAVTIKAHSHENKPGKARSQH